MRGPVRTAHCGSWSRPWKERSNDPGPLRVLSSNAVACDRIARTASVCHVRPVPRKLDGCWNVRRVDDPRRTRDDTSAPRTDRWLRVGAPLHHFSGVETRKNASPPMLGAPHEQALNDARHSPRSGASYAMGHGSATATTVPSSPTGDDCSPLYARSPDRSVAGRCDHSLPRCRFRTLNPFAGIAPILARTRSTGAGRRCRHRLVS